LILIIVGGLAIFRSLGISDVSDVVKLLSNQSEFVSRIRKRFLLVVVATILFCVLWVASYFVFPIWALINSWGLFYTDAMWYKVIIVLILQVLSFFLLCGYFTQQLAKMELSNNQSKLSSIKLRVNQLQSMENVPAEQIEHLKTQYFKANKYRFEQQRMFCSIPICVPILNEAFIKSKAK